MPFAIVARKTGDADVLAQIEIEIPVPGPGEVLIRHEAIGVNFIDIYRHCCCLINSKYVTLQSNFQRLKTAFG